MPFISIQSASRTTTPPAVDEEYQRTAWYFTQDNEVVSSYAQQAYITDDGLSLFVRVELTNSNEIQVYRYASGDWVYESSILPPVPSWGFGYGGWGVGLGDLSNFGVSSDGTYAVIPDPEYNSYQGIAYVYHFNGTTWDLQASLVGDPSIPETLYSSSGVARQVGISHAGDRLFIVNSYTILEPNPYDMSTYGEYHTTNPENTDQGEMILVFERTGSTWSFAEVIRPPLATIVGITMSGNGNVIVFENEGGYYNYDENQYRFQLNVYERVNGSWTFRDGVFPPQVTRYSGGFVQASYDGSVVLYVLDDYKTDDLMKFYLNDDFEGNGYVFERVGNKWDYVATLSPSYYQQNPSSAAMSSDGQTIIIGRYYGGSYQEPPSEAYGIENQGIVNVYKRVGVGEWKFDRNISCPHDIQNSSSFGFSVAITGDGRRFVVGDWSTVNPVDLNPDWLNWYTSFHVYDLLPYQAPVKEYWEQNHAVVSPTPSISAGFGTNGDISGDGSTLITTDVQGTQLYVYVNTSNVWTLQTTLTSPLVGTTGFIGGVHLSDDGNTAVTLAVNPTDTNVIAFERVGGIWNSGVVISNKPFLAPIGLSGDGATFVVLAVDGESVPNTVNVYKKSNGDPTVWAYIVSLGNLVNEEANNISTISLNYGGTKVLLGCKGEVDQWGYGAFNSAILYEYVPSGSPPG